jgi:AcrR family transcriptional regulator
MSSQERVKRGKQSKEETRRELVGEGQRMLLDGVVRSVEELRLSDVVKRVGLSTGPAYHVWPGGQTEFVREVVRDLVEQDAASDSKTVADAFLAAFLESHDPQEVIVRAADAYLDAQLHDTRIRTTAGHWHSIRANPDYEDVVRAAYGRYHDTFSGMFQVFLDRFGLTMTGDLTVADGTVAIAAVLDGFMIRARIQPDIIRPVHPTGGPSSSLLAAVLVAVVRGLTVPTSTQGVAEAIDAPEPDQSP